MDRFVDPEPADVPEPAGCEGDRGWPETAAFLKATCRGPCGWMPAEPGELPPPREWFDRLTGVWRDADLGLRLRPAPPPRELLTREVRDGAAPVRIALVERIFEAITAAARDEGDLAEYLGVRIEDGALVSRYHPGVSVDLGSPQERVLARLLILSGSAGVAPCDFVHECNQVNRTGDFECRVPAGEPELAIRRVASRINREREIGRLDVHIGLIDPVSCRRALFPGPPPRRTRSDRGRRRRTRRRPR